MRFSGHVVWITGATAGIGRELARVFAAEGADVAVSGRRRDRLDELAGEIESRGRRALAVPCDVAEESQIAAAVDAVVDHFGRLDVAVANAGFGIYGRIEEVTGEEWRRQFAVNVIGLALTARYALPHLRQTKGRVVLVGSVAGMLPVPHTGAYGASKAAVVSIGRTLAAELHGSGVSCTSVHPGFVDSEITRVDNSGVFHPDRRETRPRLLMWPTERAARVMVNAIHRRRRELVFTGHGKVAGFLGRHFPALMHVVMSRRRKAR
jgi:NAD(P)-dependent dehydrogenase (short-subunit alcohol dehydrogenase family)